LDPLYLFFRELKDKNLKKIAIENVSVISLALEPKRTREQLIPFLEKLFIQETQ
jgi:hypothetical protein